MRDGQKWQEIAGRDYAKAMEEFRAYRQWLDVKRTPGPLVEDEEAMAVKLGNDWLLGCDPEFVMLDGEGRIVNTQGVLGKDGQVGYDHNGHVIELRPQPAKGTYMVLKRMKKLMDEDAQLQKLRQYKWRSGAIIKAVCLHRDNLANAKGERTLTLGGHVHLDMPPKADSPDFKGMLEAEDRFTNHLEQLDILPKDESLKRRAEGAKAQGNQRYGQFKDYRPAGNNHERMEYRTMCSWLFHPHVAFLCLTGAKLCAIAPLTANEYLRPRGVEESNLRRFFEAYKNRDSNARRVCEKLLDGHDLKYLQHDPGVDFKETWRALGL